MDRVSAFFRNMNKRAWLAWLTGMGIVGAGFITGEPNEWPMVLKPWWITINAGFLGLMEFYTHQEKDSLNSRIAELVERLKRHEPVEGAE